MTLLPGSLRSALTALGEGQGRNALAARSRSITATYRARGNSREAVISNGDALAYAMARMPATYAAAQRALQALTEAAADFRPLSVLDVGCGPGTAGFAAAAAFPSVTDFTFSDRNGPFLALAEALAPAVLAGRNLHISPLELEAAETLPGADLVIASYVLAERPAAVQAKLVLALWQAAQGALVLVEPGTPDGFRRLAEARAALVALGGHIAAPCTHENLCPKSRTAADDWCRFFVRVQRSRDHRHLKGGDRPFEDEPFIYLAVMREPATARLSHRIVGRPNRTKACIKLPVCGGDGASAWSIASREKKLFKLFHKMEWGDAVLIPIQAPDVTDEV
ncbi:MAG: SAM-dependent methyltransferase [Methylocystis sp.]|nr:SAM-dependent methyltransferase [Methylocystis sp.]MCA3583880.1 SAM-dependent methyltransferase [Methylocystis sp.]MCA3589642.1 SAM-dependent methyltransferase [Methylocystis sp.]MCA3593160.1 SAM-dependent methyltransferase [Methylocystis sp.]